MDQGVAPVDDVAEPWPLLSSTAEAADTVKDDGTEEPPPMTPPDVKVARRLAKGKGPAAEENGAAVAATGTTLAETQAKEGTDNPVALAAATQLTIATPPPPSAEVGAAALRRVCCYGRV